MDFLKIANGCKFTGECDWISKNSQNVQSLSFFQKIDGFFERNFWPFENLLELAKLPTNATGRSRILKTFKVKNLGLLLNLDVSFKKTFQFLKNR